MIDRHHQGYRPRRRVQLKELYRGMDSRAPGSPPPGARILTLHPQGKQGVNIDAAKYGQVRAAILEELAAAGELTFATLVERVAARLKGRFEGSVTWYVTVVKLDLEARGALVRVPHSSPQRVRAVRR